MIEGFQLATLAARWKVATPRITIRKIRVTAINRIPEPPRAAVIPTIGIQLAESQASERNARSKSKIVDTHHPTAHLFGDHQLNHGHHASEADAMIAAPLIKIKMQESGSDRLMAKPGDSCSQCQ